MNPAFAVSMMAVERRVDTRWYYGGCDSVPLGVALDNLVEWSEISYRYRRIKCVVSPSVKCRDEDDFITIFELIVCFTLKFPVCVIDQNKDAWSSIQVTESAESLCPHQQ